MKIISYLILFLIFFTFEASSQTHALTDHSRAIEFYSNGRLENAVRIDNEANGLVKILRPRNRAYSTLSLQVFLEWIAKENLLQYPDSERLQIGDLSAQFGGAVVGHTSHQNGLDADVAYLRVNRSEQNPEIKDGFLESFVIDQKITSNFDSSRNEWLLRTIIQTGLVNRIFVDEAIKQHYCRLYSDDQSHIEFLRRLRPWVNHHNHFHIRLNCPINNSECTAQDPPLMGHGCDSSTNLNETGP